MSSLQAREELKLRRGVLHTDAVRHAVGGSSHRLATWAASRLPTESRDRHHVVMTDQPRRRHQSPIEAL